MQPEALATIVAKYKFLVTSEQDLSAQFSSVLITHGIGFKKEVAVGNDRIDFMLEDDLGVELKVRGSFGAVARQLHHYARSDKVPSLVLLTTLPTLSRFGTSTMCEKPFRVILVRTW